MVIGRQLTFGAALVGTLACQGVRSRAPAANLLIATDDSTFWVVNDSGELRIRRSEILLARYGGRFYEVYVTDDDRSFYDAVIVGQRIFRRDIVAGDSTMVYEDPEIASLARQYAAQHPGQRPLTPGEDEADDPSVVASTETELVEVLGPYLTVEQHAEMEMPDGHELHETHRSVIDLRTGQAVPLDSLLSDSTRERVLRAGKIAVEATFDSVRRSSDERARFASSILNDFDFDASSFSLIESNGTPAVAFLVPGRGRRAGGYALPLPPIAIPPGDWWNEVRASLRTENSRGVEVWKGGQHDLVVRYDSSTRALVALRNHEGREWEVTRIPAPVLRVHWLDTSPPDTVTLRALARAFDEAASYSHDMRTTMIDAPETLTFVFRPNSFRVPSTATARE